MRPQSARAGYLAACATRDLSAAIRSAAGAPCDALWYDALASLRRFIDHCDRHVSGEATSALRVLHRFLEENGDALEPDARAIPA